MRPKKKLLLTSKLHYRSAAWLYSYRKSDQDVLNYLWTMNHTCVLDVADNGGATLEEIAKILRCTRERVRQIIDGTKDPSLENNHKYVHTSAIGRLFKRAKEFHLDEYVDEKGRVKIHDREIWESALFNNPSHAELIS